MQAHVPIMTCARLSWRVSSRKSLRHSSGEPLLRRIITRQPEPGEGSVRISFSIRISPFRTHFRLSVVPNRMRAPREPMAPGDKAPLSLRGIVAIWTRSASIASAAPWSRGSSSPVGSIVFCTAMLSSASTRRRATSAGSAFAKKRVR